MQVPSEVVTDGIEKIDCVGVWENFFISDENWDHGVAKKWAGFFLPNRHSYTQIFKAGNKIRLPNGDVLEVIRQSQAGNYLNIFLDGQPLDSELIGLPNKFEVTK